MVVFIGKLEIDTTLNFGKIKITDNIFVKIISIVSTWV